jgi:4-carboxymuconolactone decarboxylase
MERPSQRGSPGGREGRHHQGHRGAQTPTGMEPDEEAAYNFANELLETKHVSDATFKAAVDRFGEKGVVDIIGVMGYYQMVSMC